MTAIVLIEDPTMLVPTEEMLLAALAKSGPRSCEDRGCVEQAAAFGQKPPQVEAVLGELDHLPAAVWKHGRYQDGRPHWICSERLQFEDLPTTTTTVAL